VKPVQWLCALVALNVMWVTDLFVLGHGFDGLDTGGGLLTALGRLTGLYGALTLVVQLVLVARLPWLETRLGMDRLTVWHRWSGFWVLWLVLAHLVFVTLGYAAQDSSSVLGELGTLVFDTEDVGLAAIATVLLVVVGLTSARRARRRLRYESWHAVHLVVYLAVLLGFLHQVSVGEDFTDSPVGTLYWWSLYGFALGAVLATRIGLPVLRNLRHRLRVVSVVRESADVVAGRVRLRATRHDRRRAADPEPARCPRRAGAHRTLRLRRLGGHPCHEQSSSPPWFSLGSPRWCATTRTSCPRPSWPPPHPLGPGRPGRSTALSWTPSSGLTRSGSPSPAPRSPTC
jgi:DMSO/TMAO reductase YedYZ heme-binding membrane subunit